MQDRGSNMAVLALYSQTCPLLQLQLFWIQAVQTGEKVYSVFYFSVSISFPGAQYQNTKNVGTAFGHTDALTTSSSSSELKILSRSL